MAKRLLRKALSAPGLLLEVRAGFEAPDDPVSSRGLPGSMIETRTYADFFYADQKRDIVGRL